MAPVIFPCHVCWWRWAWCNSPENSIWSWCVGLSCLQWKERIRTWWGQRSSGILSGGPWGTPWFLHKDPIILMTLSLIQSLSGCLWQIHNPIRPDHPKLSKRKYFYLGIFGRWLWEHTFKGTLEKKKYMILRARGDWKWCLVNWGKDM